MAELDATAYTIAGLSQVDAPPDMGGPFDNPKSAKLATEVLRRAFPGRDFGVLRDGVRLTDAELDADITSYDIQSLMEESTRLPPNYRKGRGTEHDDVAVGREGNPIKVWGPDNPDDRYD